MKILFLEDSSALRADIVSFLREDNHKVIDFYAIVDANEYLEENPQGVDCIIADLNMDDRWLGKYRSESKGCVLSGWVWLQHFVWETEGYKNVPCVIFSGYINYLRDHLNINDSTNYLEDYGHQIWLVEKGTGYRKLKDVLQDIQSKITRGYRNERW